MRRHRTQPLISGWAGHLGSAKSRRSDRSRWREQAVRQVFLTNEKVVPRVASPTLTSDAYIDRSRRRTRFPQLCDELREAGGKDGSGGRRQLPGRPPAHSRHELRFQVLDREVWHRLERLGLDEEVALDLAVSPSAEQRDKVGSRPDPWPERVEVEADLLTQLATQGVLVRFAGLDSATGATPDGALRKLESDEEDRAGRIANHRSGGVT